MLGANSLNNRRNNYYSRNFNNSQHVSSHCYLKRPHELKHLLVPFGKASQGIGFSVPKLTPDPIFLPTLSDEA